MVTALPNSSAIKLINLCS